MFKKVLIGAALLSFAAFSPANAAFVLSLDDGVGGTLSITDGGAGDLNAAAGRIAYSGSVGGWNITVVGGVSKPALGSASQAVMTLTIAADALLTGSLTVSLSDQGFGAGVGPTGSVSSLSSLGGSFNDASTLNTYADNSDALFGTGILLGSLSFTSLPPGASVGGSATLTSPYSLTMVNVLSCDGDCRGSTDSTLVVPEPATLAIFGTGLVFLGFAVRRRRKVAIAA